MWVSISHKRISQETSPFRRVFRNTLMSIMRCLFLLWKPSEATLYPLKHSHIHSSIIIIKPLFNESTYIFYVTNKNLLSLRAADDCKQSEELFAVPKKVLEEQTEEMGNKRKEMRKIKLIKPCTCFRTHLLLRSAARPNKHEKRREMSPIFLYY